MRWLADHYFAEGPGIPKDAPKRTGLALIAETAWRESVELMKLNLLFVLYALPIFTLPAAVAALMRVTLIMAEDRNVYLWADFHSAFRRHFVRSSLTGLFVAMAIGIPAYAAFAYGKLTAGGALYAPAFVLASTVAVFMTIAGAYFFAFLVCSDAALTKLASLALRTALARPLPVLAAFAFIAALWLAHILFYPVSVFMPAVINFSFGALAVAFSVLEPVKRLLRTREEIREEAEEAMPGV
jgi:uncharacterized membrane protein YesL